MLTDKRDQTPLHVAINAGKALTAQWLAKRNPDLANAKDYLGNTPLLIAVQNLSEAMVDVLLDLEADVAERNNNGETAIHLIVNKISSLSLASNYGNNLWPILDGIVTRLLNATTEGELRKEFYYGKTPPSKNSRPTKKSRQ